MSKPNAEQTARLASIIGWVQSAKATLPAINDGVVSSDRILEASKLLDRMHRLAMALKAEGADASEGQAQNAPERRRQAA